MPITVEIVRLAESRIEEAGGVIARAFVGESVWDWVLPDAASQLKKLDAVMVAWCRYGYLFAEAYTAADPGVGAAVWLPPDPGDSTPEREAAAGYGRFVELFGEEGTRRLGILMDNLDELHHRHMTSAHWYLWVIGVDPLRQGQGIGSALMQPVFQQADRAGQPCFLETHSASNVRFYQRHGFAVIAETDLPEGGPHFWLMVRPPRQNSGIL